MKNLNVAIYDRIKNCEMLQFAFGDNFTSENAVVVCEIYRYKGEWKFNAVGSGFFGGLAALCHNFGIDVIEQMNTNRTPPPTLNTEEISTMPTVDAVEQKAEKISLKKGQKVSLTKKADSSPILVENGWTASGKDYDLKALVRYRNGKQLYVGAANDDELLETPEGAVRHCGDVTEAGEMEKIIIKWHPDIASVALSSYSALENGFGSFRQYGVFVRITNGKQVIEIPAQSTSAKWFSYTLCFGEVIFGKDKDSFDVSALEMYSRFMSESRIGYRGDKVVMDIGPRGKLKKNFFSNLFGAS